MSVLTLADKPDMLQIAAIERGLPSSALAQVAAATGVPKRRLIEGLRFAPRTITLRERERARFTPEESERIMRVIRLRRILRELFTTEEAIAGWLTATDSSLGNRRPLDFLTTDLGAAKVENLAKAMIHGVPV